MNRVDPALTTRLDVPRLPADLVAAAAALPTATLHEAYARPEIAGTGFGMFLAGPSKTADIEQALVIGAHGARSLVVAVYQTV